MNHPAHLASRPRTNAPGGKRGMQELSFGALYVPPKVDAARPMPLFLLLHGASGRGRRIADRFTPHADARGLILLAPDSNGRTWDQILDQLGPDVEEIDAALMRVFTTYTIDAKRIAVGGFSDGASYALTLGLANGDLFSHVLAFSPGFIDDVGSIGKPRIFISHGTDDPILPIDRCSRLIAPRLQRRGYEVRYREFDGGHEVPKEMAGEALDWLMA